MKRKAKTLIVDGNLLLNKSFYGAKYLYSKITGEHIGGLYQFITTLRKQIKEFGYNKVVVFWDGSLSGTYRAKLYPLYKANRVAKDIEMKDKRKEMRLQKERIKLYLEEVFVRQYESEYCEADDCIAYYCINNGDKENITIYTSDLDLFQLLSDNVRIFDATKKTLLSKKAFKNRYGYVVSNLSLIKTITGDKSDNIAGIKGIQEKTLIELFPKIKNKKMSISEVMDEAKYLLENTELETRKKTKLTNLINGITNRDDYFGDAVFTTNNKLVNLYDPILDEQTRNDLDNIIEAPIDPEDREEKNLLKMMMDDGFIECIPGSQDGYIDYIVPFLNLTITEKNKYKNYVKNG